MPNIILYISNHYSWQDSYRFLGYAEFSFMVVIGFAFFRKKPEVYGYLPDGDGKIDIENWIDINSPVKKNISEDNWTASEAIRSRYFWAY